MSMAMAIAILLICTVVNALFAGYETGFVSLNPLRIRYLAEEEQRATAKRLLQYSLHPDQMLAMLLIANNICTVVATIAMTRGFGELGAVLIATPVMLLFAEIIPKSIFRAHPNRLSLAFLPVIHVVYLIATPLAAPIAWLTRLLFRRKGHHLSPLMTTREDVRVLVDESADHGISRPKNSA